MAGYAAIVKKDLMLEVRGGRITTVLVSLALLVLVVLVFAFDRAVAQGPDTAAGALWIALVFAGMLGATRVVLSEQENGCLRALLLSPLDRATIYAAKLTASFGFMVGAAIAATILAMLFFNLEFSMSLAALILGALGFSALATLLAVIAARARGGELLLPLLIVPLFVPALIAGVKASAAVLSGAALATSRDWVGILIAFDVLFVTAGYLLFEHVVGEE